jgi:threonine aldolase
MRQAGILAAAGLYALENNIERLAFDHERALRFATAINGLANFSVNLSDVQTNMCYVDTVAPAIDVVAALADRGVYLFDTSPHTVRVVTHLDVDDADIDRAITAFKELDNL